MSGEIGVIFGSSIETFDKDDVLMKMVEANEGAIFVLGTRRIYTEGEPEDENEVEITFAQIKKVRSN